MTRDERLLQYLQRVKEVIPTPKQWTKGAELNHINNRRCLIGAMKKAGEVYVRRSHTYDLALEIVSDAIRRTFPRRKIGKGSFAPGFAPDTITCFNDRKYTRHKDVLRVLDIAIEQQEAKVMWRELRKGTKRVPRQPKAKKEEVVNAVR